MELSERLDMGLIYISSSLSAWDSPHILAPTVGGSKNLLLMVVLISLYIPIWSELGHWSYRF